MPDVVAVGGLTLGADPLVTGVAMASDECLWAPDLNGLIVRKEPKGYGTGAWIEGPLPLEGAKVTVLEKDHNKPTVFFLGILNNFWIFP